MSKDKTPPPLGSIEILENIESVEEPNGWPGEQRGAYFPPQPVIKDRGIILTDGEDEYTLAVNGLTITSSTLDHSTGRTEVKRRVIPLNEIPDDLILKILGNASIKDLEKKNVHPGIIKKIQEVIVRLFV